MEPIITGGGVLVPPDGYVEEVARICRKNGVLFIVDEVICGFGRTGRRFGYQHYGVKPDIVTMAKGITSAYLPLSATAVKREIFEAFKGTEEYDHFRHVNTFGGNPAACALAVKNLEIMEEEDLSGRSAKMGERLRGKLAGLEDHPNVGEIRHKGLLFGIELVEDRDPDPGHGREGREGHLRLQGERANRREERRHGGRLRNVITLAPPLVVSDDDLEFISGALSESLRSL